MGVREDRLAKWPIEVYVNEMRALGIKDGFKDVENYAKEHGYLIDVHYTGHSYSTDEIPKLLIEVDRLKIPAGPIAVLPHVHHRIVVFSGSDRAEKAKHTLALARPMQLERLLKEVFASSLTAKAILTDEEYDHYETLIRRVRSFIQGFTSLAHPGYEITRQNNMIIFSVLDGILGLQAFTVTFWESADGVKLTMRKGNLHGETLIGTFEPTFENGQNAWKLMSVHVLA